MSSNTVPPANPPVTPPVCPSPITDPTLTPITNSNKTVGTIVNSINALTANLNCLINNVSKIPVIDNTKAINAPDFLIPVPSALQSNKNIVSGSNLSLGNAMTDIYGKIQNVQIAPPTNTKIPTTLINNNMVSVSSALDDLYNKISALPTTQTQSNSFTGDVTFSKGNLLIDDNKAIGFGHGQTGDSYYMYRKVGSGGDADPSNALRIVLNDDGNPYNSAQANVPPERMQIWGGNCNTGNCDGKSIMVNDGTLAHDFDILGNASHFGYLNIPMNLPYQDSTGAPQKLNNVNFALTALWNQVFGTAGPTFSTPSTLTGPKIANPTDFSNYGTYAVGSQLGYNYSKKFTPNVQKKYDYNNNFANFQ